MKPNFIHRITYQDPLLCFEGGKRLYKLNNVMRSMLFLIFLITSQFIVAQQSLQFTEIGLTKALEQSKISHKPVFFFCYASWCPHCKKMRETLFTDPAVIAFYDQHFVCVQQDMEKGVGVELHKRFDIKSYPTFIFIDSSGTILYRLTGEFKAAQFIAEGENALTPTKQLPYLKVQFEKDVSNSDKCLEYLRALKKGDLDYSDIVQKYFATQSDNQLLTEKNWVIIANGTTDINSREFQFVLSHRKAFASIASRERVERKIFYLVKELLTPLVEANDTSNYFIKRQPVKAIGQANVDSLVFAYDIMVYQVNSKWKEYQLETLKSVETYAWNNNTELADIAGVYLKHIADTAALAQAVMWAKRSLNLHEEYGTYLLTAKLYQKLNNKPEAIQEAKKAKELAVKDGWDYTEADSLLKELQ